MKPTLFTLGAVAALAGAAAASRRAGSRAPGSPDWGHLYRQADEADTVGGGLGDSDALVTPADHVTVWHGQGLGGSMLTGMQPLIDRSGVGKNVNYVGRFLSSERDYAADKYGTPQTTARFRVPPGRYAVFEPHGPDRHLLGGDASQMPRALLPIDPRLLGRELFREARGLKRKGEDWYDWGSRAFALLRKRLWTKNPDYVRRLARYYLDRGYRGFVWRDWVGDAMLGGGPQDVWVILGPEPVAPQAPWGSAARRRRRGSRSALLESFGMPEGATRTSSTPGYFGYRWGPAEWDLIDNGDGDVVLENVWVNADRRGQGHASRMMWWLVQRADELGVPLRLRVEATPIEYQDDDGELVEEDAEEADERVAGFYMGFDFTYTDPISRRMRREPRLPG